MKIVKVVNHNNDSYDVNISLDYDWSHIQKISNMFPWENIRGLNKEVANIIAECINSAYNIGVNDTKRNLAIKLGLTE